MKQNNISEVWRGLKTMPSHKKPNSQPVGHNTWMNVLNTFFNRFEHPPFPLSSPPCFCNPYCRQLCIAQPPTPIPLSTTFSTLPPSTNTALVQSTAPNTNLKHTTSTPVLSFHNNQRKERTGEYQGEKGCRARWYLLSASPASWNIEEHLQTTAV